MANIETKNAIIESTMLGIEDHGIMTCWLHLKYDGSGQGFGGHGFDGYDKEKDCRVGHGYGIEYISEVLRIAGVTRWEKLTGQNVRVKAECGKVHAIGHIIEDIWFNPEEFAKEHGLT